MGIFKIIQARLGPAQRAVISFSALCGISAMMMGAQLLFSAQSTDEASLERQLKTAAQELDEIMDSVPRDQQSITIWDQAVVHTAEAYDPVWVDENIGTWVADYFGHNEVYVLDGAGSAKFGYAGGQVLAQTSMYQSLLSLSGMIEEARTGFAQKGDTKLNISGIVQLGDKLVYASVSPIVPYTDKVATPASPFLHVSVRYLDEAVAELRTSHQFEGATATVALPVGMAALPLKASDGSTAGYFAWEPFRPGAVLMRKSAPALAAATLLLVVLTWWASQRMLRAANELKASEAQARHLAFHDPLTGLANRALFTERLEAAQNSLDEAECLAVHFIDLDNFKDINDTLGHGAGDQLLKDVASAISNLLGEHDLAARLGGDEFVVMQRYWGDPADAGAGSAQLVSIIREVRAGSSSCQQVSASLGTAISAAGVEPAELIRRADIALYRAKAEGKNGYQLFTPDMDEVVQGRRLLEVDLAQALAAGDQLHLAYQPLHSGANGEIIGVEALARWNHPTKGNLPPSLFIPVAEASGLIVPMGEWILRTACRQALYWNIGYVAVNVSPIQFRQPGFAASVKRILDETGLHPSRLELEITEGVLVDKEKSGAVLAALRDAGIKIAIDDFGTGYSSLSYLRQLDVDKIKIDQSFVRQADDDEGARSIIFAMVQLAGALNMQVTAEGVETKEQRAYLSSIGCDQLQGYLLSRPLTASAMEKKLNETAGVLAA